MADLDVTCEAPPSMVQLRREAVHCSHSIDTTTVRRRLMSDACVTRHVVRRVLEGRYVEDEERVRGN
jgi:hypothetical protein